MIADVNGQSPPNTMAAVGQIAEPLDTSQVDGHASLWPGSCFSIGRHVVPRTNGSGSRRQHGEVLLEWWLARSL